MTSAMLPRSRIFAGHVLTCTIFAAIGTSAHADSTPPDPPRADQLIGSWLTTYQVAAFGGARPILLSFTRDGIVIETDTPAIERLTPLGRDGCRLSPQIPTCPYA
jgi:hypothetical protein